MRYKIIGTKSDFYQERIGEDFVSHRTEEIIATFDTAEMAIDYIKQATLKYPRSGISRDRPFRINTLLSDCEAAVVEEITEKIIPPHNPSS